jgi:hypothetical protein
MNIMQKIKLRRMIKQYIILHHTEMHHTIENNEIDYSIQFNNACIEQNYHLALVLYVDSCTIDDITNCTILKHIVNKYCIIEYNSVQHYTEESNLDNDIQILYSKLFSIINSLYYK